MSRERRQACSIALTRFAHESVSRSAQISRDPSSRCSPAPVYDANGWPDHGWRVTSASRRAKLDGPRLREENLKVILNLLWSRRTISRADLARETGLSRSTVSSIVATLLQRGLVTERGAGGSRGGRPPVILGFDDDRYTALGVELDTDTITVLHTNLRGAILAIRRADFPVGDDPAGSLALTAELVREIVTPTHPMERVLGLGVALPCPVDPLTTAATANLLCPRWDGVLVAPILSAATSLPVLVEKAATAGALAEQWWGAEVCGEDLVYVVAGSCVDAGFVVRGDVYRGTNGAAGQIAHVQVDDDGPPCVCGLRGCLITRVGGRALLDRADGTSYPNLAALVARATAGDAAATAIIAEAGAAIGRCIATILNLANPSLVVLGGPLAPAGEAFMAPLRAMVRARAHVPAVADTPVIASALGPMSIAVGAATLVIARGLERTLLDPATL